jgi:hypothetical protein
MGLKIFHPATDLDEVPIEEVFVPEIESACFEIINAYKPTSHNKSGIL